MQRRRRARVRPPPAVAVPPRCSRVFEQFQEHSPDSSQTTIAASTERIFLCAHLHVINMRNRLEALDLTRGLLMIIMVRLNSYSFCSMNW
jgi:hypothetical protein